MRNLSLLLLLFPVIVNAQLDRLRADMNEQEFVKSFPEAIRDYDEESYWTGGADTLNGVEGSSLWLMYNDTVKAYRFLSVKVQGPSSAYPNFDSTAVHNMKVCLDKVRAELETEFGKPEVIRNNPLSSVGNSGVNRAYSALWKFPGSNNYIQLSVSTDLSSGNYINAPGKYTVVESQSYEMRVEVTQRNDYTMLYYDLGKSSSRFYTIYKNYRAPLLRDHIYTIMDSVVSSNAAWTITFTDHKLSSFRYNATTGTGYGSNSDAVAYFRLKVKCDQFIVEGEKTYGYADSVRNNMKEKYTPHDRQVVYDVDHIFVRWKSPEGKVDMKFEEVGGGKNPDVTFHLQVVFEKADD